MKKNYLFLAAAATMFTACVQSDLVSEIPEAAPQAISFETFANKQTRATENSGAAYDNGAMSAHHADFAVWAYKNTSNELVFNNTKVNSADYKYDPLHYWDKTATAYQFYAAAPQTTTPAWDFVGDPANKANAYFKLTDATLAATNFVTTPSTELLKSFKDLSGDVDWMIAAKCGVGNAQFGQTVQLNFIHILSRLNVIVKKSATAPEITLKSVTVKGLNLQGTFNESLVAANGSGKTSRWAGANPALTTKDYAFTSDFKLTTDENYVIQSLVIPQEVDYQLVKTDGSNLDANSEAYLKIVYNINRETFEANYNLAAVFGASSGSIPFNEGYQNTLTITIAPDVISFNSSVASWADSGADKNIE